jgi:hypothetical protein
LGAPSAGRGGSGQAGDDSSIVRPMTPVNGVPSLYVLIAIVIAPLGLSYSGLEFLVLSSEFHFDLRPCHARVLLSGIQFHDKHIA